MGATFSGRRIVAISIERMNTIRLLLVLCIPLSGLVRADEASVRKAVEGSPRQEYFLIDHSEGAPPKDGYKLLLVLPGVVFGVNYPERAWFTAAVLGLLLGLGWYLSIRKTELLAEAK